MLSAIALTSALAFGGALDRLGPDGAAHGFLVADDANAAPHLSVSALVLESWAQDPVVLRDPAGHIVSSLVSDQWTTTAAASVGLFDRLELSAKFAGAALDEKKLVFAALSPRVALKGTILTLGPVALGARGSVDVAASRGDVTRVAPALLATFTQRWLRAGVDVGTAVGLDGSARVDYAAGAAIPVWSVLSVDADVFGSYAPGHTPLEATLAGDAKVGSFDVVAGVGGGLIADVGTPHLRAFAAVRFALDPEERAASTATPIVVSPPRATVASTSIPPAPLPPTPAPVEPPPAAAPTVAIADDHIELDEDVVLFDVESDALLPSALPLLDEVARVLTAHGEIARVVVEGHADATGDAGYNQKLSLWRALVVREYLIAHGIAPSRLGVLAFGTKKPRASNDTEAGRRLNRRVELVITKRVDVDGGAQ